MNKNIITDNHIKKIVKRILESTFSDSTSSNKTIEGREFKINGNGTVSIKNSNGEFKRVRFSALGIEANIVKLITLSNGAGYRVITLKGVEQDVTKKQAKVIINFVDTGKPNEIDSGDWATPNLHMRYT